MHSKLTLLVESAWWNFIAMLLSAAAFIAIGVTLYNEHNQSACFRSRVVASVNIGAEDRRVTDGFLNSIGNVLLKPSNNALPGLQNAYRAFLVQRHTDDAARRAVPVTKGC